MHTNVVATCLVGKTEINNDSRTSDIEPPGHPFHTHTHTHRVKPKEPREPNGIHAYIEKRTLRVNTHAGVVMHGATYVNTCNEWSRMFTRTATQ